jgi:hypothetical protein
MYTGDVAQVRVTRIVYARWNQLAITALGKDGMNLFRWVIEDNKFGPDHRPLTVTWEHPDFPEKAEEYRTMDTPRELFNIRAVNQPEDSRLTAIRELLMSYDEESESPNEILHAIHEVLWGPTVEPAPVEGPTEPLPE